MCDEQGMYDLAMEAAFQERDASNIYWSA